MAVDAAFHSGLTSASQAVLISVENFHADFQAMIHHRNDSIHFH